MRKHDGLRHVDAVERAPRVLPQKLSGIDRQAHRAARRHDQNLPNAAKRHEHRRGVPLFIVLRLPHDFAGGLAVGDDGTAARAAWQDDHFVVDNQGRGRHAPREVGRPVVGQDIPPPHQRAAARIEHAQLALGAERVDAPLVIRRRRARPIAAHRFLEVRRPAVRPQLTSAPRVVGRDHFLIPPLLDRERATIGDDK